MEGGITIDPIWLGIIGQAAALIWAMARASAKLDHHERRLNEFDLVAGSSRETAKDAGDRLARIEERLNHIDSQLADALRRAGSRRNYRDLDTSGRARGARR